MSRIRTYFTRAALIGLALIPAQAHAAANDPLIVFLVRHAEKVDSSATSPLTEAGYQRSATLAKLLRDAQLEGIHSTDFVRTRETAAPVATSHQIDVEIYDHQNLPKLVEQLKATGGRHLVVGHSNTTPAVVELLGGDPGTEIEESSEYDRLYLVSSEPKGNVTTVLIRFGVPFTGR